MCTLYKYVGLLHFKKPKPDLLQCDSSDNEGMDDVISYMVGELGYDVEMGEISFSANRIPSQFNIPFVNIVGDDSLYGYSYFFGNGWLSYRLTGRDIILFRGCTPPKVTYFSFVSYSSFRSTVSGPELVEASLGDSLNNLVIKTEGDGPFDSKTTVITTGIDIEFI